MAGGVDEAFVTHSIAAHLQAEDWQLHSVARPQIGSGVTLRPNPDPQGRRPKNEGGVVIDIIASRAGHWLFLESKDRFSMRDLHKLSKVRDSGLYVCDLSALTGGALVERLLFGLGMPHTSANEVRCLEHGSELDLFIGVDRSGACGVLGGSRPLV